jgi:lipopolysaccharide export system protein LptA
MTMRAIDRRRLRYRVLALFAAGIAVPLGASHALAQPKPAVKQQQQQAPQSGGPPNALQGFSQNRDQPVKINADGLQVNDHTKVATFSGNVRVVQGDTTMRCRTLMVYYDSDSSGPSVKAETPGPAGSQQIRKMVASGGVLVSQKDQTASGDTAVYDMPAHTVTLSSGSGGAVTVTQGPNIMKGASLTVDLTTSVSHLKSGGSQQVEGLLVPNAMKGERSDTKAAPDAKSDAKSDARSDAKSGPKSAPKPPSANPTGLY